MKNQSSRSGRPNQRLDKRRILIMVTNESNEKNENKIYIKPNLTGSYNRKKKKEGKS